jgi:hypothetical protein
LLTAIDDVTSARIRREIARVRKAIGALEESTAAMCALPAPTSEDAQRIVVGWEAMKAARERASLLERLLHCAPIPVVYVDEPKTD